LPYSFDQGFREHHLDRDLAVLERIEGLIDGARGALAELADDLELADLVHRHGQAWNGCAGNIHAITIA
jgi:hypothetical protein